MKQTYFWPMYGDRDEAIFTWSSGRTHQHLWGELDAKQLGVLQSLMATCRLHDINPYDYLVDVLQRVAPHPAKDVAALRLRLWKQRFAANSLRADVMQATDG